MKFKSNFSIIFALLVCIQLFSSILVFQVQASEDISDAQIVVLETTMGNITIKLRDDMPITVGNFLKLLDECVYDNTIFHRVIADFMIQGGDPNGNGLSDDGIAAIPDEFTEDNHNYRGTIAMANAGTNTGSSQFSLMS